MIKVIFRHRRLPDFIVEYTDVEIAMYGKDVIVANSDATLKLSDTYSDYLVVDDGEV